MTELADEDIRAICDDHELQSVGMYRTVATHLTLLFVEPNPYRMDFVWDGTIQTVGQTRFVERRSGWTGKGIEGPPQITASVDGAPLEPRRHGPLYRSGKYEKYLIDLGDDIEPGRRVTIRTESRYVDEAASFKPFLSAMGRPSFEELSLTVKSGAPIVSCEYAQFDGDNTLHSESVEPIPDGDLQLWTKSLSSVPGARHQLSWVWESKW